MQEIVCITIVSFAFKHTIYIHIHACKLFLARSNHTNQRMIHCHSLGTMHYIAMSTVFQGNWVGMGPYHVQSKQTQFTSNSFVVWGPKSCTSSSGNMPHIICEKHVVHSVSALHSVVSLASVVGGKRARRACSIFRTLASITWTVLAYPHQTNFDLLLYTSARSYIHCFSDTLTWDFTTFNRLSAVALSGVAAGGLWNWLDLFGFWAGSIGVVVFGPR